MLIQKFKNLLFSLWKYISEVTRQPLSKNLSKILKIVKQWWTELKGEKHFYILVSEILKFQN